MFMVVIAVIFLQHNWIYDEERFNDEEKDKWQVKWEMWLLIEMLIIVANICAGASYLFCSKLKKKAVVYVPEDEDDKDKNKDKNKNKDEDDLELDFIDENMFIIDMTQSMLVPGLVGCFLYSYKDFNKDHDFLIVGILCIFQTFLWFINIFVTRVSEVRDESYIKCWPELTYYAGVIAFTIVPFIIICVNKDFIKCFTDVEDKSMYAPFGTFCILSQIVILVNYFCDFKGPIYKNFEESKEKRAIFR